VTLVDVTWAREPLQMVAAQAAWGANDSWRKLQADREQWPIWAYLIVHAWPGFVPQIQVRPLDGLAGCLIRRLSCSQESRGSWTAKVCPFPNLAPFRVEVEMYQER